MFCQKCRKNYIDIDALFCKVCGSKLFETFRVIEGPLALDVKRKIVQVVELQNKTRQIHVFDNDGIPRPITTEDDISWDDLKFATKIPIDIFFSILHEIKS